MKDNRRRDMTLTIRVTEKEKQYIKKRAEKAGLSTTDYIVRLSLETPIFYSRQYATVFIGTQAHRKQH